MHSKLEDTSYTKRLKEANYLANQYTCVELESAKPTAGTGDIYAYLDFDGEFIIQAIEVLNETNDGLESTTIYFERGRRGEPTISVGLKDGFSKKYQHLIWTGELRMQGQFRIVGKVRHILSNTHSIKVALSRIMVQPLIPVIPSVPAPWMWKFE